MCDCTVYTIGHSTKTTDQFYALIKAYGIEQVVDVRTIPRSRHNPQFNAPVLSKFLRNRHVGYRHMKSLGGLRHPIKDSLNSAWLNNSFRGYADYMLTKAFRKGFEQLLGIINKKKCVIMCAEALPWRCHRSLIADILLIHGYRVCEIISLTSVRSHNLTPWARVVNDSIIYDKKS